MSTSWSRKIGSFVGGALAGPGGAIIGGIATSILGQATGIDGSIGDAIGGVVGDQAGALLGRLNAEEKQQINHDLQSAFRDAFCEAVYDIGGETCFAEAWKGSRDVPREVVYPKSVGHHLWATKDPLADQLCESLHQIEQAVDELLPFEPPADHVAANVERYLSADSPQALADEFFKQILAPYLTRFRVLFLEVPDFEPHLRRYLFNRLLVHLGEHLKQRPEAWRAFNRLVLEEIRLRVRALGTGQAHITGQLEQIMARLSRPLDANAHRNGNPAIPSLTDELAQLLTAMGRVESKQNEGFDGLLDRVGEQHNELMASLRGLMRIEESGKRTLGRVEDVAKQVERVEQKVDQVILRQPPSHPTSPAPPFTAPKPPEQFVQRPAEFDELTKRLLASGSQRTVAITTALQGGGGFGKTTLAQAICHDERVKQAFPDGILWLTVGQSPSLVELLAVQIKFFAPTENYADINAAANRLRALLSRKRVLIVLDDVWQEYHARPFVQQDSPTCAHLITTRQQEIARWLQAQAVNVNEMQTSQAVDLLIKWLAGTAAVEGLATDEVLLKQLHQLAEYLGEWPLLLELVAAQLRDFVQRRRKPLSQAIQDVKERLKRRGFTAFDRTREKERNRAISISLGVSLDELDGLCEEALGDKDIWRQRYLELAIFPEDVEIPLTTIFKLWEGTAFFDELDSEDALYGMQNLSLFTRYDADKQTVRLHDVIRAYLAEQQASRLPDLHRQFLAAYDVTNWANLPADEPYLWEHLAYHLREAQRHDDLRALLLDFAWMIAKLHATDINALLADYDKLPDDNVTERVQRILSQASHILARDKNQLAGQLWGRLPEDERTQLTSLPQQKRKPAQTSANSAKPLSRHAEITWLRPLYPSLRFHPILVRTFYFKKRLLGVAMSADGRWVLSAYGRNVKVSDLTTGKERLSLVGHTDFVTAVAVSPDARWALSASNDHTMKVWDLATGKERLSFVGYTDNEVAVTSDPGVVVCTFGRSQVRVRVAVSPDGRRGLSTYDGGKMKVWDLVTGKKRLSFADESRVAVSADVRWALSISGFEAKVWDLATGQERLSFKSDTDWFFGVGVSADGRWGLSSSRNGTRKVWDLATGKERITFKRDAERVNCVEVSADGQWGLSRSRDRTMKVWDLATGPELLIFKEHTDWVTKVAMSADGRWALSTYDHKVNVWDLANGKERFTLKGHTDHVTGVAVSADGRWALTASDDHTVKVWDLATLQLAQASTSGSTELAELSVESSNWGKERLSLVSHTDHVTGVAVSADGRWALTASKDKTVKVWNLATGKEHLSLVGHTDDVRGLAMTADGRWTLVASGKIVKVWDLASGQERLSFAGHTSYLSGVAVTADGRWGLSASHDKIVKVWDLATGQEYLSLAGHTSTVTGVAVSTDGRWALVASGKIVKVWDLATGQEHLSLVGHTREVTGVAVSADRRWALSASDYRTVKVWDLATGKERLSFVAHTGRVTGVAVSADGRWALSTSHDKTVKVWSLTDGRMLATLDADEVLLCCAMTLDGMTIVVAGTSGRVHFLRLEGAAVEILVQRLGRTEAIDKSLMERLNQLAHYLGELPLLLNLAGAQLRQLVQVKRLPLDEAIGKLREALQEEGFDAFDREDDRQRDRAIRITLSVILKRLGKWRKRFMELAVFPANIAIPDTTIFKLWSCTDQLTSNEAKKALQAMRDLLLFSSVDTDTDKPTVCLPDLIRAYLVEEQAKHLPDLHRQLLSAYGLTNPTNWAALPEDEPYLWHHFTYHLHEAKRDDELRALLLDFAWIEAKLNTTNIISLLTDYDWLQDDEVVQPVGRTLRQAGYVLVKDKSQLAGQLVMRLLTDKSTPIQSLLAQALAAAPAICWRPLTPQQSSPLIGHASGVNGVAVTADGRWALSASSDHTVKVWDLATGQERLTLKGHTNIVTGVAVSADGRLALSASEDQTVKVWDLATGQEGLTLKGHTNIVTGVAVSADGRWALSASGKTVKVWNLATGEERFTFKGHTNIVTGVAVTADGRWALSASSDRTVKVWDSATGQEHFTLKGHTERVNRVAVSADGRWALSASDDGTVKVWDLANAQERLTLKGHTAHVTGVAVGADGRWALIASGFEVKVWDLTTEGHVVATFNAEERLQCCAMTQDGMAIVAGGASGRVHFLRLEGGAVDILVQRLGRTEPLNKSLMEQLNQLAQYLGELPLLLELAGGELRQLVQAKGLPLDEAIGKLRETLQEEGFDAFDCSDYGQCNRAIDIGFSLRLEPLGKWRERFMELAVFPANIAIPDTVIFKLWSLTGLKDKQAKKAWRAMRDFSLLTPVEADKQAVGLPDVIRAYLVQQQAEHLPDLHGQFLSAYGLTNWAALPKDEPYLWHHLTYHLHEAKHHSKLRALLLDFAWIEAKLNITNIYDLLTDYDWLPDDEVVQRVGRALRQAAPALAKDKCQLVEQLLGRLLADKSTPIQSLLAQALAAAPAIWLRSLTSLSPLIGHTSGVKAVAVTADGRWALSTSGRKVKVWNLATGQERLSLVGHTSDVNWVAVTADGRRALSASGGTMKVWDLATGQERLSLVGHTLRVTGMAVSADGRWALFACFNKSAKVWDLASAQERFSLVVHPLFVTGIAVTADGRWALFASADGTVKVWDLATGQEHLTLKGHTSYVNRVAVSADGRWALSASRDYTVKVWDLATGQERLSFTGHTSYVNGMAVSADGRWAFTASKDHTVKVWSLTDGRVLATLDAGEALLCSAITPDGMTIVAGGASGRLHFLRLEGGAVDILIERLGRTEALDKRLREQLNQLAQYLGELPLLLELAGGELRQLVQVKRLPLDEAIGKLREALEEEGFDAFDRSDYGQRNRAIDIGFSVRLKPLGKWRERFMELAVFPANIAIPDTVIFKLWSQTGQLKDKQAKKALQAMRDLSLFSPVDADKQTVDLPDVIRAYLVQQQAEHLPDLHRQLLSAYELTNWAALPKDEPYLWHHLTYHLHEAKRHSKLRALLLDFAWLEAKLNAINIYNLLRDYDWLWDDEVVQRVGRGLRQAAPALAKDKCQLVGQLLGRLLADKSTPIQSLLAQALTAAPAIWLRPLTSSLQELSTLIRHTSGVTRVAVSADGRWALSASGGTVKVWDLATGQERLSLAGHTDIVSEVAVTADGRWALSASWDHTVKVWSLKDGRVLATFDAGEELNCCAVAQDGLTIVAAGESGRLHFLRLEGLS